MEKALTAKSLFGQENIKVKFQEILGSKAQGFITSVLQIVASNDQLLKADPMSIYNAAATAATLDLPVNNNLGFSYIIPFNSRQKDGSYKMLAQFMVGYKGFIQLAQRSGQFKTIAASPIYEGQLVEQNPLTGFVFDFTKKKSETIVGYASYFQLLNGFEKTLFMTVDQLKSHGSKYSQTFKKGFGLWKDDFDSMSLKTVIKLLLSKYAPLSIEMQKAITFDQGIINNLETEDVTYIDNEKEQKDPLEERAILMIQSAKTLEQLEKIGSEVDLNPSQLDLFNQRKEELKIKK